MDLILLLTLLACLGLLVLGAWCVSEGGDILGSKYDATIVGGFLIAWLNTAPETIFFITALESGNPDFAVGAVSGSVIVVCTVAVGCCIWFGSVARRSGSIFLFPDVKKQARILGMTLFLVFMGVIVGFNYFLGLLCVLEYGAFIVYTLLSKSGTTSTSSSSLSTPKHDVEAAGSMMMTPPSDEEDEHEDEEDAPTWKGIAYLTAGGLLIYTFSGPFIRAVVEAGQLMNVDPVVLAFFFAPLASEAPEIIESISLSRAGKAQNINIAFSNLVGGTISKTTLLFGILCLYCTSRNYPWVAPAYTVSILLIILCAGSTAFLGTYVSKMNGKHGKMLVGIFLSACIIQLISLRSFGNTLIKEEALA